MNKLKTIGVVFGGLLVYTILWASTVHIPNPKIYPSSRDNNKTMSKGIINE